MWLLSSRVFIAAHGAGMAVTTFAGSFRFGSRAASVGRVGASSVLVAPRRADYWRRDGKHSIDVAGGAALVRAGAAAGFAAGRAGALRLMLELRSGFGVSRNCAFTDVPSRR